MRIITLRRIVMTGMYAAIMAALACWAATSGCSKASAAPDAPPLPSGPLSVVVTLNGSHQLVVRGESIVRRWTSTNSTACQKMGPDFGEASAKGGADTIAPGSAHYPKPGETLVYKIGCGNTTNTAEDAATATQAP